MSTHGLDQSQALTRAAQKLSAARARYLARLAEEREVRSELVSDVTVRAKDALESAKLAYKAAYKAYTNPFGVRKTS